MRGNVLLRLFLVLYFRFNGGGFMNGDERLMEAAVLRTILGLFMKKYVSSLRVQLWKKQIVLQDLDGGRVSGTYIRS